MFIPLQTRTTHFFQAVTVFNVSGGCRGDEITHVMVNHVTDTANEIVVRIPESKTYERRFAEQSVFDFATSVLVRQFAKTQ